MKLIQPDPTPTPFTSTPTPIGLTTAKTVKKNRTKEKGSVGLSENMKEKVVESPQPDQSEPEFVDMD